MTIWYEVVVRHLAVQLRNPTKVTLLRVGIDIGEIAIVSFQGVPMVSSIPVNSMQVFAESWAQKYKRGLDQRDAALVSMGRANSEADIADQLSHALRAISLQAWTKTEALLAKEVARHGVNPQLIDPWEISKDAHGIYQKALSAFAS